MEASTDQPAQDRPMHAETAPAPGVQRAEWHFAGPRVRLLFLCKNNSARSQMAEAITRHLTHNQVEVFSAGSHPAAQIHPRAVRAIARLGGDVSHYVPKSLDQFAGQPFDRVIVLRARDREEELAFPTPSKVIVWDFADPVEQSGTDQELDRAFEALAAELTTRIRLLLNILQRERRERVPA